jgi:hypothetical protein
MPDGETLSGARAMLTALRCSPNHAFWLWLYDHIPTFAWFTEFAYQRIVEHRTVSLYLTRLFFGRHIVLGRYEQTEWLFLRWLGAIYGIGFASLGVQVTGLIGANGILPASRYLGFLARNLGTPALTAPTLFWLRSDDGFLRLFCVAGVLLAATLIAGRAQRTCLILLFALYLSLCSVGQDFLSFQWDYLLLEAGFLAIFLGGSRTVVWLYRWLLFRLMFSSGLVKLTSHDPTWSHLDALNYHYWTQPLPTPVAWYMAQLPAWFQRLSTACVLSAELLIPFLIFFPRRIRLAGAVCLAALQCLILVTGNYTFFNWLTLALCLFLLDDHALPKWRWRTGQLRVGRRVAVVLAVIILCLSVLVMLQQFTGAAPLEGLIRLAGPFGIVNTYGLFAEMTTTRAEIIVQGSADGSTWADYEFPYKPGDLRRAPRWVAPFQPRLDWQMWFAALSNWRANPWFVNFMLRLLEGSPEVTALLAKNPFPVAPPRYVRALLYQYRFTDFAERKATGNWWRREPKGEYFPAVTLQDFQKR